VHNHKHRHIAALPRLPVAHSLQLRLRIRSEQPLFARRQGKLSLQERSSHGLKVPIPQPPVWLKWFQFGHHS
jgi:hypothetical protein